MMTQFIRSLVILSTGVVVGTIAANVAAVQAADLVYTGNPSDNASFDFSFSSGAGSLTLEGVLTEPGLVTTQYSEIQASALSSSLDFSYVANLPLAFPNPRQLTFSFDPARDATLTFDNGNLTGLLYTSENQSFTFTEGRSCGLLGGCTSGVGFTTLFLEGDRFRQFVSIQGTETNIFGQVVGIFQNSGNVIGGPITFSNSQPVAAVPEPSELAGSVLALGCFLMFGKQMRKKRELASEKRS